MSILVVVLAFCRDSYDGYTISAHLEQIRPLTGYTPDEVVTDRGYRRKKEVGRTKICNPTSDWHFRPELLSEDESSEEEVPKTSRL